jgi:hypothetical protein
MGLASDSEMVEKYHGCRSRRWPRLFFFRRSFDKIYIPMAPSRSRFCWLFFLALAIFSRALAQAPIPRLKNSPGLAVTELGSWKTVRKGTEFRKVKLERAEPHHALEIKLVRLDTRWIEPHVVRSSQYHLKSASVKTLAEKSGAIAMINANYFDEKGAPLGFLKTTHEATPNLSKSPLYTGVFAVKDRAPFIVHRDQFMPHQADEALQVGPLLLAKGIPLTVTRGADRQFRRSLIGMDSNHRLIVAVTDTIFGGLTWVELQEFFGSAEWQVQTTDLLNLDGGGSTQLHVRGARFEEYVPGTVEVPVAIGLFPAK